MYEIRLLESLICLHQSFFNSEFQLTIRAILLSSYFHQIDILIMASSYSDCAD